MIEPTTARVLLVEDNELDRRMMCRFLSDYDQASFDVVVAGRLSEALDVLDRDTIDCVLLDLSLPDSEGLASVDALLGRSPKSPIVVLSGLEDPLVAIQAVARGAQDYVTKQRADPELVGRSIRYAIARHYSENQLRVATERLEVMEERHRIARDLHDTVIQQLFATGMGLQALIGRSSEPEVDGRVETALDSIDLVMRQLRAAIFDLHTEGPNTVTAAISDVVRTEQEALGFPVAVRVGPAIDELVDGLVHDLVSTLQEGLSNVAKHARATAVQVVIETEGPDVVLRVIDNGRGIPSEVEQTAVSRLTGRGIDNMRQRAVDKSGTFTLGPGPGGGTELVWRAPISR